MSVLNVASFISIVQGLSGLTGNAVGESRSSTPLISDTELAYVSIDWGTLQSVGTDETRRVLVGSGNTGVLTETVSGSRQIVITIRCEEYDIGVDPKERLDRITMGLDLRPTVDALYAIGLALAHVRAEVSATYTVNSREVRMAQADYFFNASNALDYVYPTGQGWIDTVNGTDKVPGTTH